MIWSTGGLTSSQISSNQLPFTFSLTRRSNLVCSSLPTPLPNVSILFKTCAYSPSDCAIGLSDCFSFSRVEDNDGRGNGGTSSWRETVSEPLGGKGAASFHFVGRESEVDGGSVLLQPALPAQISDGTEPRTNKGQDLLIYTLLS
jgi:hypothetical protein